MTLLGLNALPIEVEVDAAKGLPQETVVGLPGTIVKESKNRIRSALKHSQLEYPLFHYTFNLSPADLKKEGSYLDLAMAVGILASTGQISQPTAYIFVGELALDGRVQPVKGILAICQYIANHNPTKTLILPQKNAAEASVIDNCQILPIAHLRDISAIMKNTYTPPPLPALTTTKPPATERLCNVNGQESAKRALQIALSGGHNILMVGPPGAGKSLLASTLPSLLPSLSKTQAIECHTISSIAAQSITQTDIPKWPPFRSPHHTISYAGMVGGGTPPKPGEISLAHNGILFLDELPEFKKQVLELLRQPMENHSVTISRAHYSMVFPAHFLLVAAMNPCPCGYANDPLMGCSCTPIQIKTYSDRISGPILDRIDMVINVERLDKKDLFSSDMDEIQAEALENELRNQIKETRDTQFRTNGMLNATLSSKKVKVLTHLNAESKALLENALDKGLLTGRSFFKTLKVANTIALMENAPVSSAHIAEALHYSKVRFNCSN
ncbi:MAG: YifB family Mg chelatase-like AAA ATPase [bacterium]|nr:YifB family Mg chelatase-like AAA ATPase [bacterium]